MVLMFQKEVADRFVATSGSKIFGPPSVLTWLLTDAQRTMVVRPGAFKPPPKVDSAIIQVDPLPSPRRDVGADIDAFNRFIHGLFQQRRKTIQNNLKRMYGADVLSSLDDVGIPRSARSEAVRADLLVDLWRRVIDVLP
jgi:16S rRNA (adenine1518-N6/adenine1519-N6)-dimethyltransferase